MTSKGELFCTHNGYANCIKSNTLPKEANLFAVVGYTGPTSFEINLGQKPFRFPGVPVGSEPFIDIDDS
jgi:hypothetical protein